MSQSEEYRGAGLVLGSIGTALGTLSAVTLETVSNASTATIWETGTVGTALTILLFTLGIKRMDSQPKQTKLIPSRSTRRDPKTTIPLH